LPTGPSKFDRAELIAFLRLLDGRLTRPGTIRLIGGAVVGLCYLPSYRTRDIDYAWADREVQEAILEVRAARPELVITAQTGVYFAPYSHESRLETLAIPGLRYLVVEVPERHDLAVMKAARSFDRDLEAVAQMHALRPFQLATLVERFEETWVTGPQRLADLGFLSLVEALFGEEGADDAERLLEKLRQARPR
jgi:hypothetical protein